METWRPIPFTDRYEASSYGRIRSVDRIQQVGLRFCRYRSRLISRLPGNALGHLKVRLGLPEGAQNLWAHRVIAAAFLGPAPDGAMVLHRDGNPANNRPENLRYGTQTDNMEDRRRHSRGNEGSRHPMAKLSEADVREIWGALGTGERQRDVASRYGVTTANVAAIAQGKSWRHLNLHGRAA